jgi:hypothetical protein
MLLHCTPSPKSFEDLCTYRGAEYRTFRDCCRARGLLEDNAGWDECLAEASQFQLGAQIRHLFVTIICNHGDFDALRLFNNHFPALSDDLPRMIPRDYGIENPSEEQIRDVCLSLLEAIIRVMDNNKRLQSFGLPLPTVNATLPLADINILNEERRRYDADQLRQQLDLEEPLISTNAEQVLAVNSIMQSVNRAYLRYDLKRTSLSFCTYSLSNLEQERKVFFLQGPGGTGKTFVENHILAKVRAQGDIALAVASSRIASLLLQGGRTAHSRFKLALDCPSGWNLPIARESLLAQLFREVKLIIWDEAPMQHRHCAEAVNRALQDLRDDIRLFGGVTMVFAGDLAQTLPVVVGGSSNDIIAATIQKSSFWRSVTTLKLSLNMRLSRVGMDDAARQQVSDFARWLRTVGTGSSNDLEGYVTLPQPIQVMTAIAAADGDLPNVDADDLLCNTPMAILDKRCP